MNILRLLNFIITALSSILDSESVKRNSNEIALETAMGGHHVKYYIYYKVFRIPFRLFFCSASNGAL